MLTYVLVAGLLFGQIGNAAAPQPPADPGRVPTEIVTDRRESVQELEPAPPSARPTGEWRSTITAWRREVLARSEPGYQFSADDLRPLLAIRDRKAVPALLALLKTERERRVRTAYMEALATIGGKSALDALVRLSLDDSYGYQRLAAGLISRMPNRDEAIPEYAKALAIDRTRGPALDALRRCGLTEPLPYGQPPDPVLTKALIDSLVVKQVQTVPAFRYREWYGVRGLDYGTYRRGYVPVEGIACNDPARTVLKNYTGQDFGYDQDAWTEWCASQER
jgi:hypothetical protein